MAKIVKIGKYWLLDGHVVFMVGTIGNNYLFINRANCELRIHSHHEQYVDEIIQVGSTEPLTELELLDDSRLWQKLVIKMLDGELYTIRDYLKRRDERKANYQIQLVSSLSGWLYHQLNVVAPSPSSSIQARILCDAKLKLRAAQKQIKLGDPDYAGLAVTIRTGNVIFPVDLVEFVTYELDNPTLSFNGVIDHFIRQNKIIHGSNITITKPLTNLPFTVHVNGSEMKSSRTTMVYPLMDKTKIDATIPVIDMGGRYTYLGVQLVTSTPEIEEALRKYNPENIYPFNLKIPESDQVLDKINLSLYWNGKLITDIPLREYINEIYKNPRTKQRKLIQSICRRHTNQIATAKEIITKDSAYSIAVQNGFTGSVGDYLKEALTKSTNVEFVRINGNCFLDGYPVKLKGLIGGVSINMIDFKVEVGDGKVYHIQTLGDKVFETVFITNGVGQWNNPNKLSFAPFHPFLENLVIVIDNKLVSVPQYLKDRKNVVKIVKAEDGKWYTLNNEEVWVGPHVDPDGLFILTGSTRTQSIKLVGYKNRILEVLHVNNREGEVQLTELEIPLDRSWAMYIRKVLDRGNYMDIRPLGEEDTGHDYLRDWTASAHDTADTCNL